MSGMSKIDPARRTLHKASRRLATLANERIRLRALRVMAEQEIERMRRVVADISRRLGN